MLAWSKTMKERQLLWTTFCVLCLLENPVSGDATNSSILTTTNTPTINASFINSTVKTTPLTGPLDNDTKTGNETTVYSSPVPKTENETIFHHIPIIPAANVTLINETAETIPVNGTNTPNETTMTQKPTSTPLLTSGHTEKTSKVSVFLTTAMADNSSAMLNITCVKIKQLTTATKVICLELTEAHLCEHFKTNKGVELSKLVCKRNELTCLIELAESDVNHHCMLLVAVNNKGADVLSGFLDDKQSDLNVLGIKSHKQEPIEAHQVHSRKTLIALVTTGLLFAFLGLAGYYLMKRRSWSPMGERLGEDPYYTENDSHGNPVMPVASHEQSDLQDKPNLNGGARENGTGQPTSKNGHSTRPQVVADTEL